MTTFQADPEAVLDWSVDWSSWLAESETIDDYTITVPAGLTLAADSENGGIVTIWLTGGTAGTKYRVECKITTNQGRTDERSFYLAVKER